MNRLCCEEGQGTEKFFCIKEEDFAEFPVCPASMSLPFAAVQDTKANDGLVALVTNTDFVPQVNLFMQRRGYPAPRQRSRRSLRQKKTHPALNKGTPHQSAGMARQHRGRARR